MSEKVTNMFDWLEEHPSHTKTEKPRSPQNAQAAEAEVVNIAEHLETNKEAVHTSLLEFRTGFLADLAQTMNRMDTYIRFITHQANLPLFHAEKYQLWLQDSPDERLTDPLLNQRERELFSEIDTAIAECKKLIGALSTNAAKWQAQFNVYKHRTAPLHPQTQEVLSGLVAGLEKLTQQDITTLDLNESKRVVQAAFYLLNLAKLPEHLAAWDQLYSPVNSSDTAS